MADNKTAATIGVSTAILIVGAIATNLKPIAEGLMAFWLVLVAFTKDAPAGVGAFFLALGLAMLSQPFLRRAAVELRIRCAVSLDFFVETAAVLIGLTVMVVQAWSFQGAMVGLLAGLLAIWLQKGVAALWNLGARIIKGPPA